MAYLKFPVTLAAALLVSLLTGWAVGAGKSEKSSAFISVLHSDAPTGFSTNARRGQLVWNHSSPL